MVTKNTMLSVNDLSLLDGVIIKYGKIVFTDDLRKDLEGKTGKTFSEQGLRNRLAELAKKGWLIRIKRGMYIVITDVSSLGMSDVSDFLIARLLNYASYVSFEAALQHYGMFDQRLSTIDSVTRNRARNYIVKGNKTYRYLHLQLGLYDFGQVGLKMEHIPNEQMVRIATREKALLDMLYFRTDTLTASLVLEKLNDYRGELDFGKLKYYALNYSTTMIRRVGFLLDQIGVDTEVLLSDKIRANTYSKLGSAAETFNAKWRLYYDDNITHQGTVTSDQQADAQV